MKNFKWTFAYLLLSSIHTSSAESFSYDIGYSKTGDTLETIAERYLPSVNIQYSDRIEDYKNDLLKWNPNVKDWEHIPKQTPFYVSYPYSPFVSHDMAPPLQITVNEERTRLIPGLLYTASAGQFTQKSGDLEVKTSQNSLFSLGGFLSADLREHDHFLVTSFYWSKLTAGKVNGNITNSNTKIQPPSELGFNLYYQYTFTDSLLSFYTGIDYESFGTYNINDLTQGETLVANKNTIYYATVGMGKTFSLSSFQVTTKLSFATTISSKSTSAIVNDNFDGSRALFYFSIKDQSHFGYHLLLKRHDLKGPNKLSINRIGMGIDYTFD